jgi:hypothetical protein
MAALGIEPETSGSVARNSDHQITEAVEEAYTLQNLRIINIGQPNILSTYFNLEGRGSFLFGNASIRL